MFRASGVASLLTRGQSGPESPSIHRPVPAGSRDARPGGGRAEGGTESGLETERPGGSRPSGATLVPRKTFCTARVECFVCFACLFLFQKDSIAFRVAKSRLNSVRIFRTPVLHLLGGTNDVKTFFPKLQGDHQTTYLQHHH